MHALLPGTLRTDRLKTTQLLKEIQDRKKSHAMFFVNF